MKRAILESLNTVHPYQMPELALHTEINCRLKHPCSLSDMRAALRIMEAERLVAATQRELDQVWLYRITDAGRGLLAG